MSQEKHYEMLWDCQFCGATKLLGKTHRFCPNCGAPQNADARYFPPDDEKIAVEDHEYVGADKICPACDALNAASAVHCGNCGAPLDSANAVRTINDGATLEADEVEQLRQSRDVMGEKFQRDMKAAGVTTGEKKKKGNGLWIGLLLLAVVCGGIFWMFSQTRQEAVIASAHAWEREIQIEEYRTVRDGAWQNSVPSGAFNRSCSQRQSGTERIPDGQDCRTVRRDNGDGTFSERQECTTRYREEPVYSTWCDYSINRWVQTRTVRTTGTSLSNTPAWGVVQLKCTGQQLGCEREAGRTERYEVTFTDSASAENYTCDFPQAQWQNIRLESAWEMEVRQFMGGAMCETLTPR